MSHEGLGRTVHAKAEEISEDWQMYPDNQYAMLTRTFVIHCDICGKQGIARVRKRRHEQTTGWGPQWNHYEWWGTLPPDEGSYLEDNTLFKGVRHYCSEECKRREGLFAVKKK